MSMRSSASSEIVKVPARRERMDTKRNRARLLAAVREVVRDSDGDHISMQDVAERAELSTATAYRYFSSVADLIVAYRIAVVKELLDYRKTLTAHGTELFELLVFERGRQNLVHGHTMARLRSSTGFLTRLQGDEQVILLTRQVWESPVREVIEEFGLPADRLPHGLFLCNLFLDPRDFLDLVDSTDMGPDEVSRHLISAFYGALRAW